MTTLPPLTCGHEPYEGVLHDADVLTGEDLLDYVRRQRTTEADIAAGRRPADPEPLVQQVWDIIVRRMAEGALTAADIEAMHADLIEQAHQHPDRLVVAICPECGEWTTDPAVVGALQHAEEQLLAALEGLWNEGAPSELRTFDPAVLPPDPDDQPS